MQKKRWASKNLYYLIDKEIKGKFGVTNMNDLTKQQIRKNKINRPRLFKCSRNSMYVHKDILIPVIMNQDYQTQKQSNLDLIQDLIQSI